MNEPTPTKLESVSESTRERETFRYYPFLAAYFRFARDGQVPDSDQLTNASNSALSAIAQLGAHQTKTDKAFISLFDATHQYILVETSPSLRIAAGLPNDSKTAPLALCGTAIPRNQGTCDHILYLAPETNSDGTSELPLSLVPNLGADSRFTTRPYCQFGEAGQFYCGVPIRTRRGIDIGAYCVMSSVPPKTWNDQSAQYLRDISKAITEQLEYKRAAYESRQQIRMNRGLGAFLEGKGTIGGGESGESDAAFRDNGMLEGTINTQRQRAESLEQEQEQDWSPVQVMATQGNLVAAATDDPTDMMSTLPNLTITDTPTRDPKSGPTSESSSLQAPLIGITSAGATDPLRAESNLIFSKAANIIREAFETEACVFLATSFRFYDDQGHPSATETTDKRRSSPSGESSSDEYIYSSLTGSSDAPCDMLAFSASDASSVNNPAISSASVGVLPQRLLAKMLRKYPQGKIFNFDQGGEIQSSDFSDAEHVPAAGRVGSTTTTTTTTGITVSGTQDTSKPSTRVPQTGEKRHRLGRSEEAALIQKAFPSARSVAFAPVWDAKADRWFAGGFMYTRTAMRVFSTEGELSFLMGFTKVIAAELGGLETAVADKAKSDILGSLSHELRSPLHGAVLSAELLNDTDMTVFQGNATHTIEICCRTLLDTIDHLLDFAKVNSFAKENPRPSSRNRFRQRQKQRSVEFGKKSLDMPVRLDGLIEEVVGSVYSGYTFQYTSARQLSMHKTPIESFTAARKMMDADLAAEDLGHHGQGAQWGGVFLYTYIDPLCQWNFHVQPGMLRRIVMNLVGNSLKYTASGSIRISLEQHEGRSSRSQRFVTITVQDTGKGISKDFLRHKLFQPFSQEDELQPGTGLGLSLVKKITTQLKGQINVESSLGVGTTVKVTLPLQVSRRDSIDRDAPTGGTDEFDDQVEELAGLRVQIPELGPKWSSEAHTFIEDVCRRWLRLEVVRDQETVPDIVIRSEDTIPDSPEAIAQCRTTPNIVLCRHAVAAAQLSAEFKVINQEQIFEFMPQPVGPRSLARSIALGYRRWVGLPETPFNLHPPKPRSSKDSQGGKDNVAMPDGEGAFFGGSPSNPPGKDSSTTRLTETPQPIKEAVAATPDPASEEAIPTYLLVDDNKINLRVLAAFINKYGGNYEVASNGQEAIDAYFERPGLFTAILMDISMPVMNGLEATRRIRAYERRENLRPVTLIALTGLSSDKIHQEASESGVNKFLTKPVDFKMLGRELGSLDRLSSKS